MSTHTHTHKYEFIYHLRDQGVWAQYVCVCVYQSERWTRLPDWDSSGTNEELLRVDHVTAHTCEHAWYPTCCTHTHTHTHVSCYSLILLQWWGTQDTRRHISCMCVCADGGSVFMFSSVGLLRLTITGVRPKCLNPAFFLCAFTGLCGWFPNELMVPINSFHFSSSQDEHPWLN